jgi:hypothetical protein
LHNPRTSDYLYTQNPSEICGALKYAGYVLDGPAFQTLNATDPDAESVYRLSRNGIHLFTTSYAEVLSAMQNYGFTYEGVPFYESSTSTNGDYPVYRLSENGTYFLTTSVNEANLMTADGYTNQGVFFNAPSPSTTIPVYRLSKNGMHLYTTSAEEADLAVSQDGYTNEGIAFYGQSAPTGDDIYNYRMARGMIQFNTTSPVENVNAMWVGFSQQDVYAFFYPPNYSTTTPVYRLVDPSDGDYLLTTSLVEKDEAVQDYGYVYQGIAFGSD